MEITNILRDLVALGTGLTIGALFALLQLRALRKNQELRDKGELENAWKVMRASPRRVLWFLLCLVGVQILFPSLFIQGAQWWVSGGVVFGYGVVQFGTFRAANATADLIGPGHGAVQGFPAVVPKASGAAVGTRTPSLGSHRARSHDRAFAAPPAERKNRAFDFP